MGAQHMSHHIARSARMTDPTALGEGALWAGTLVRILSPQVLQTQHVEEWQLLRTCAAFCALPVAGAPPAQPCRLLTSACSAACAALLPAASPFDTTSRRLLPTAAVGVPAPLAAAAAAVGVPAPLAAMVVGVPGARAVNAVGVPAPLAEPAVGVPASRAGAVPS